MTYAVKEIFFTLQGEGANAGRPAVFCRFAGCNLWSGREVDRADAICQFCDTDFVGTNGPNGGKFPNPTDLAAAVAAKWPEPLGISLGDRAVKQLRYDKPLVVCTGGEPLLQLDEALIAALHKEGFEVAVETNGTQLPPCGVDWLCVSPKARASLVLRKGNELKLVFPQDGVDPSQFTTLPFDFFFLQPMDGPDLDRNTQQALRYCLEHPQWRLSLQTHKLLGIP